MKFQKLTIHNIASIEDAVIDFGASPLSNSEVFLITGNTGSGKSTILDAICLALYASTPRFEGSLMEGDSKDCEDKTVKVTDPRQLLRKNTGEGYTELSFVGNNGIKYEAKWSVARARGKVEGNLQSKKWQLKIDNGQTLAKDKEIEAEIKTAIGLDFKQFLRTTMLAQGEFTRFLNSKDDDKADILEKITGVDIYTKIGAKIFSVTKQKESDMNEAINKVNGTKTLSETQITEIRDKIANLNAQYTTVKTNRDNETKKKEWTKRYNELENQLNTAKDLLDKAKNIVESEDFKQKETLVNEWNATIDARNLLSDKEKAEAEIEKQKNALDTLRNDYSSLLNGYKYAKEETDKIASEIKDIDAFLESEKDKVSIYEKSQTIIGHLTTISEGRKDIETKKLEIDKENQRLSDILNPALKKEKDIAEEATKELERQDAEVKKNEKVIEDLNLQELRNQRNCAKDLIGNINNAKTSIDTYNRTKERLESVSKKLAAQIADIKQKEKESTDMDAPIHDAKIKLDVCKDNFDKQCDSVDKFAQLMRQKMHIGDICPVCQQKITSELPHEDELNALKNELEKTWKDAEKDYNELVDKKKTLDAEISSETKTYNRDKKAFDEDQSESIDKQKALEACQACEIEFDDNAQSSLDNLSKETSTTITKLEAEIADGESKEKKVKELRSIRDKKREEVDLQNKKVQNAEKGVNDCKGLISTVQAVVEQKGKDIKNAEESIKLLISNVVLDTNWQESPKDFAAILQSATDKYNQQKNSKDELNRQHNTANNNCLNVKSILDTITTTMPEWETIEATGTTENPKLYDNANSTSTKVSNTIVLLKNAEKSLKTSDEQLDIFLSENDTLSIERLKALNAYSAENINTLKKEVTNNRDEVKIQDALLENAKKKAEEHQKSKPEFSEDDNLEKIEAHIADLDNQMKAIGEEKGALDKELEDNDNLCKELVDLQKIAKEKTDEHTKWSRINDHIGDATGKKFRKIAQSYVLASLIHSANNYMKTLTNRYTLKVEPGTFIISIEDAYQGYISRAASTISGGESFLVSLSLALALSDIGQGLSADTLFIDEGFGTLSGEPLQNAIDTLKMLRKSAGRNVGIISHIEELREKIPVQIQVQQESNSSKSTIKIVP